MRCRYCGKELALIKRLRGGGFCSEAHKQSYQDEYNQLALSRLLQAQTKGPTEPSGKNAGPGPAAPVAVEEPAAEELMLEEHAADAPVMESVPLEITSLEGSDAEEFVPDATAETDTETEPEPEPDAEAEPLEIANFLDDSPAMAAWPDETPHLEPWLEFSSGPAVADWQFQDAASTLSTAALVSLDLSPNATPGEHSFAPADLTPREFTNGHGQTNLPWKVTTMHQLPSAGPVALEVTASGIDFPADGSIARELEFETAVLMDDSQLLELPSTGIEFLNEDSAVVVVSSRDHGGAVDSASSEADSAAPVEDDSPRASLEALSRLHQDLTQEALVQDDLVQQEEPAPVAEPAAQESPALVAEPVPVAEAEPPSEEPTPRRATELLDIAVRIFPPAKPVPVEGAGLLSRSEPLLPHLKSLPLRPKVAVASGYVPPSAAPAQPKAAAKAPQTATIQAPPKDARPAAPSKPAPAARPAARIVQPKQPPAPAKAPEPSKAAAKLPPSQAAASKTAPPAPARPDATESAAKPPAGKEPAPIAASVKVAAQPAKPVVEETTKEIAKPAAKQPVKQTRGSEATQEAGPNFGAIQGANASLVGSLKVKLGIAITILVVACSAWLGWGGKSHKPGASNTAISDGSGPSIIMGEGGWVEGWGGDPTGLHAGREITIYRPSLKLSDYRIEFQGSIETQSIGWVFRAANPDNYYALKLMAVSSGLSPKVALFKYLVINGRQTQVGRVPIDLMVRADTVFSIRTDVRGPQFSTYIQGQQVDVWTDDQLKAGGVGFLNEREERGKVKSVSIRYLNGAAK
jgi:hypothetical protein